MHIYDSDVWNTIHPDDLWVYDKLILSKKLGHQCGPAGISLPIPGTYIIKPITNILGMGLGSHIHEFTSTHTDWMQPGTFWMEVFNGQHLSIDVVNGNTAIIYEGYRENPQRFSQWKKIETIITHPTFIIELSKKYGVVNYESIGGKIIEIHLRANPDWQKYRAKELIPVWKNQTYDPTNFVSDPDGERLGFIIIK